MEATVDTRARSDGCLSGTVGTESDINDGPGELIG